MATLSYHGGVEDVRKEEVEESPELVEVVLEGSAREQETIGCTELTNNL